MEEITEKQVIKSITITEKERYSIDALEKIKNLARKEIYLQIRNRWYGCFYWNHIFPKREGYFYEILSYIPTDDFFKIKLLDSNMLPTVENYVESYIKKQINIMEKELNEIWSMELSDIDNIDIKDLFLSDFPSLNDLENVYDNIWNIKNKLRYKILEIEIDKSKNKLYEFYNEKKRSETIEVFKICWILPDDYE